jgi:hypothetical protein
LSILDYGSNSKFGFTSSFLVVANKEVVVASDVCISFQFHSSLRATPMAATFFSIPLLSVKSHFTPHNLLMPNFFLSSSLVV